MKNMFSLEGKVALVTGAVYGIGFAIAKAFHDAGAKIVYNTNTQEALDMGAEEYFDSGEICLVEWPDRLGPLTPDNARTVTINVNDDGSRSLIY